MCGIVGIFETKEPREVVRARALDMAASIRHRGPDWSGIYDDDRCVLAHERLSIVDVEQGAQPLIDAQADRVLVVNGEIYNHKDLRKKLKKKHEWKTQSDCEVLLYLYDEYGADFLDMIDGIFALILYDKRKGEYLIARDHIGIIPLYMGWDAKDQIYVASEMKALDKTCTRIEEFPPGKYYLGSEKKFIQWYWQEWMESVPTEKVSLEKLKHKLEKAVRQQLMSDVPYGVLISGGLDSSLIAAIAAKSESQLHSFSVGLKDAPDLQFARKVSKHIGTIHHEIIYTFQEGIDAIKDVIRHLETFDVTTIRAATPMYLMARKIQSLGIKMVLSGEGADEVFGGYLYFHMAPSTKEFHEETVRKLSALSKYDCLRANKSMAAWGIEARVPFLDKDFISYAMSIDPADKMCTGGKMEKTIVREALKEYLPAEVLWRQKEQFSDGVGYGWIDGIKDHAEKIITSDMVTRAHERFPVGTPLTKEAYWYRVLFDEHFTCATAALTVPVGPSIACSTPTALKWSKMFAGMEDPSGRAITAVHKKRVHKI